MSENRTATVKRAIKPVTITLTVEVRKVNENGTFSGFEVKSIKGPNKTVKAVSPLMSGGAIYLKTESLEGLTILTAEDNLQMVTKTKLF